MSMTRSSKRPFPHIDADEEEKGAQQVFASSPVTDRASTFVAHFHPHDSSTGHTAFKTTTTAAPATLTGTVKAFQNHAAFREADHRMAAWRRASTQRTLVPTGSGNVACTTGSDDDGEKYAGKRLERVLVDMDVQGVLVVARWYGGVLLGPVRFTHIETVAREAVTRWKRAVGSSAGEKRQRLGDGSFSSFSSAPAAAGAREGAKDAEGPDPAQAAADEAARVRLAKQLDDRDGSIAVLRSLLADKKARILQRAERASQLPSSQPGSSAEGGPNAAVPLASPGAVGKKIEYRDMPLARLRQLDKARDATIAFILKQIDKAEEDEKQWGARDEGAMPSDDGKERTEIEGDGKG